VLRIVAEFADEWNVTRVTLDEYSMKRRALAEHCTALGRDPKTIARSLMVPLAIGRDTAEVARRIAAARATFPALPADEPACRPRAFWRAGRTGSSTTYGAGRRSEWNASSSRCSTWRTQEPSSSSPVRYCLDWRGSRARRAGSGR